MRRRLLAPFSVNFNFDAPVQPAKSSLEGVRGV